MLRAGLDVHFLTRSKARELKSKGLRVLWPKGAWQERFLSVYASPEALGPCDVVLVFLKTTANPGLVEWIQPLVGPSTQVVTFQNGLGNVEPLIAAFPDHAIAVGLAYVGLERVAPGQVYPYFRGRLVFGVATGSCESLLAGLKHGFEEQGIPVTIESDIETALWKKLYWNIPFNGISVAAGGVHTEEIMNSPDLVAWARQLLSELHEVALAHGVSIPDSWIDHQFEVTAKLGPFVPSTLQDYRAGRPLEVESLWGAVFHRGQAIGVSTPALEALLYLLRYRNANPLE